MWAKSRTKLWKLSVEAVYTIIMADDQSLSNESDAESVKGNGSYITVTGS